MKKKEERNDSRVHEKAADDGTRNVTRQGHKKGDEEKKKEAEKTRTRSRRRRRKKKAEKTHDDGQVDAASVSAQESRPRVTVGKHNGWESSNNAQRLSHNAPRGQLASGLLQRARERRNHRVYPVILPSSYYFYRVSAIRVALSFFRPSLFFRVTSSPSKSTDSWNETAESDSETSSRRTFSSRLLSGVGLAELKIVEKRDKYPGGKKKGAEERRAIKKLRGGPKLGSLRYKVNT